MRKKCYSKIASVWQKHEDILGMQKSSGIVLGIGGGSVVEAWSANLTDTGLNSAGLLVFLYKFLSCFVTMVRC